jgi:hypothetical protein
MRFRVSYQQGNETMLGRQTEDRPAVTTTRLLLMAVLLVPSVGCSSPGLINILRVNVWEPQAYCASSDRADTFHHNRELARRAWAQLAASDPSVCSSPEYRDGFIDGYADYLNLGGTGAAPPIPPRRYWNVDYKCPGGVEAIQAWYAGFEQGAAAAKESGIREVEVVPSSVLLPPPEPPMAMGPEVPAEPFVLPEPPMAAPGVELVPTPAPLPPGQ